MSETWGWDDLTGDWLDEVDAPSPAATTATPLLDDGNPAAVGIPVPRDGSLTVGRTPTEIQEP
jgi:hypothetical protein